MPTDPPSHNHNSELPVFIATQEAIHNATEEQLRESVEEVFGDLEEEVSLPDLRTRLVMALLLVKYEDRQIGESQSTFINRRNDIMATTVKKKLTAELEAKATKRAATPAKQPAIKPAKAVKPADADAAPAPRGRAPAVTKVKHNPEGGDSKLNATSERANVFELIKKAGAKGITIEALDEAFGKPTRGFVLKLLEKNHIINAS